VRLETVYTPSTSGLLAALLPAFESQTGLTVHVSATDDVFTPATAGHADLLVVHYYHLGQPGRVPGRVVPGSGQGGGGGGGGGGHHHRQGVVPGSGQGRGTGAGGKRLSTTGDAGSGAILPGGAAYPPGASPGTINTGAFVLEGYGLWPLALFNNQALVIGPPADPAGIKGMPSASAAVAKIAQSGETFLVTTTDVRIYYLTNLMLAISGVKIGPWYQTTKVVGTYLLQQAAAKNAYTVWGDENASLIPLAAQLTPLVLTDPVLQRGLVSIVVNPQKVDGVNFHGAHLLQSYLTNATTQAAVLNFREPGFTTPTFWPAAQTSA
jgi:ABC-type tungstate transport system permease subunit